jgi:hypothetical protein
VALRADNIAGKNLRLMGKIKKNSCFKSPIVPQVSRSPPSIRFPLEEDMFKVLTPAVLGVRLIFAEGISRQKILEEAVVHRGQLDRGIAAFKTGRQIGKEGRPSILREYELQQLHSFITIAIGKGSHLTGPEIGKKVFSIHFFLSLHY